MIDLWESLFRTVSALAIVLVLMGIVAVTVRRVMGQRLGIAGGRPLVRVLASSYIAPRKTIALVSVAGEYLIVGTTATDLVPLGRISDSTELRELLALTSEKPLRRDGAGLARHLCFLASTPTARRLPSRQGTS